jgi:hypothetical protein
MRGVGTFARDRHALSCASTVTAKSNDLLLIDGVALNVSVAKDGLTGL